MSDYLSPELIEIILLKLPVKPLIRFTTVCKLWRSIITNPSFISSHLHKPQNETLILRSYITRNKKEHYSLLEVAANSNPFTIESFSEFEECPYKSRNLYFRIVASCRGVVCLSESCTGLPSYLWNPRIRKHVVLPMPTINPEESTKSVLGFGVADHDLKVVRLVYYGETEEEEDEDDEEEEESDDDSSSRLCSPPEAEVFSLKTGRWRRFGVEARLPNVKFAWDRAFVNGVMHWFGRDSVKGNVIVVFRFAQEVFDEIALPDEMVTEDYCYLSLYSVGGSLAVIQCNTDFGIDYSVWLMEAYGDESSWTMKYNFSLELVESVVAIRKNGVVLVASQRIGLYALDLENVGAKNLEIYGDCCSFYVDNYVESLELLGGQRDFAEE